uniref:Uncharacterized protein n=1 Tax=Romanomermis culicivorax TaxID=13658 RepID=A0A915J1U9_ROMCU
RSFSLCKAQSKIPTRQGERLEAVNNDRYPITILQATDQMASTSCVSYVYRVSGVKVGFKAHNVKIFMELEQICKFMPLAYHLAWPRSRVECDFETSQ